MLSLFVLAMSGFPCLNALGVNTKMGNFPCNQCGRPFHDAAESFVHEQDCTSPRYMQDVDVPLTADDVPFGCDDCGKTFPSLNSWLCHSQFKCQHTQSEVIPVCAARDGTSLDVSLPHDEGIFYCSSNKKSDGSRCSFAATTRSLLEMHMEQAGHPYNCTHENCTSPGTAWKYDFSQYTEHLNSTHNPASSEYSMRLHPASAHLETSHDSMLLCPSFDRSDGNKCYFQSKSSNSYETAYDV